MADTFTPQQKQAALIKDLSRYGRGNYYEVKQYLKIIASKQSVELDLGGEKIPFTPQELWNVVSAWCSEELGFSIGDRGDIAVRSIKIQDQIDRRVKAESTATGARHDLILKQSENPLIPPSSTPSDPTGQVLQKALAIRNAQIKDIEGRFIGKLRSNLVASDIFKNSDPRTRALMLQMVAAGNHNFRALSEFVPDDLNNLLLNQAGNLQINKETHRLWSKASQADFPKIVSIINATIQAEYGGDESKYEKDMATLRAATSLSPSLSDIDWMVNQTVVHGTPAEKTRLSNSLRSEIMRVSKLGYVSGDQILATALANTGLSPEKVRATVSYLEPLSPYVEEIRLVETGKLLGEDLKERKGHLVAISTLAAQFGVDLDSAWLTPNDLRAAQSAITAKYGVNTLVEAFGQTNDLAEMAEIKNLMAMISDSDRYRTGLRGSALLSLQDAWAKTWHRPINPERFSIFDPLAGISRRWVGLQTNLAINIHDWAINVNAASWFSGFAGHIGDFTEGFIKYNANWSSAGHFFFERKWGNVLDRAAKMAGYETMDAAKAAFWQGTIKAIEVGGNKLAAGLGSKLATTLAGLATSAEGIGLAIIGAQIVWEALKFGFNKLKQFFEDSEFRNKILNWLPVTLGLGLAFAATLPALMLTGIVGVSTALLSIFLASITSLAALFGLATTIGLGVTAFFAVIWFGIISPTFQLDSATTQFVSSIICDDTGNTTIPGTTSQNSPPTTPAQSGGVLARATCLAKYLNNCYGPSVNASNISKGLSCLATYAIAPSAIAEIESSASGYVNLQCVGFVKAAVVWGGKSIGSANACGYVNDPKFVAGLSGVKQGDPIVFRSSGTCSDSAPGHIGIFKEDAGANICLVDANQKCAGCVVDGNCLPKTNIAGYLKL